ERRVREDPIERLLGKRQGQEILLEHVAPRVRASHPSELRTPFEPDGAMTERMKMAKVSPRSASEIEEREWRRSLDRAEKSVVILANVVTLRAVPELPRRAAVVGECEVGQPQQLFVRRPFWHASKRNRKTLAVERQRMRPSPMISGRYV